MEWFNNIESSNEQTNEIVQEQELDLWHQEILENYEYKNMFIDFIKSLNPEDKERFLNILKNIPDEELQEYLDENFENDSEENWELFFDIYEEQYYTPENSQTNKTPKEVLESIPDTNPKVKEIINTINLLTDTDKSNQWIIDSLIKQINELQSLNLNNQELELLKNNLIILNDYTEINKTNSEIDETNSEINKEVEIDKKEVEIDKKEAEIDKKEAKEKEKTKKEKIKWLKSLIPNINNIKEIDIDFYNLLKEWWLLDNLDDEKIAFELANKIYEYLNTWNNAVEFFEKIKKSWNTELYNKMYNSLSNISPNIEKLLQDKGILPINPILSTMPGWKMESGKYILWDKYIDFSETPPVWYITLNWLKLKTKITAPHTMKLRAEFSKKQKEYEKTVWKLKENIENLDSEITDLKDDITEKKSRIEQIKNSDVSPEDKQRFIESIKEIILKNQQLIETKIKLINENKSAIEMENAKFKKVKDIFEENMYELIEAARDELLEWDEKVRKSLQFLDSIGIDSALLPALEKMIKMINHNSALRNKLGFDRRIDLSKFDLWIDNWLGNNDEWENSIKTKEKFASIVNILLSGSKKRPIVTESMSTWTTFTNASWEILNKDRAMWDIKEVMWMNTYGHMMVNAMEYDGEDE